VGETGHQLGPLVSLSDTNPTDDKNPRRLNEALGRIEALERQVETLTALLASRDAAMAALLDGAADTALETTGDIAVNDASGDIAAGYASTMARFARAVRAGNRVRNGEAAGG
jgi:hypothetical protein